VGRKEDASRKKKGDTRRSDQDSREKKAVFKGAKEAAKKGKRTAGRCRLGRDNPKQRNGAGGSDVRDGIEGGQCAAKMRCDQPKGLVAKSNGTTGSKRD